MKFITLTLVRRLPIKGSKKNFDMYLVCSVFFRRYNRITSSIDHLLNIECTNMMTVNSNLD